MPIPTTPPDTLAPLATSDDLAARNIAVPAGVDADTVLASATDAVRDAAGCPITQASSTVDLVLTECDSIDLPGGPVTAVTSLSINGVVIDESMFANGRWTDGYRRVGDSLRLQCIYACVPATATIVYTHGYVIVPADIVDLVCALAAMAFRQDGDYGAASLDASVRLGDYSEAQKPSSSSIFSPSPVAIPDAVRERLRNRFNSTVSVISVRR